MHARIPAAAPLAALALLAAAAFSPLVRAPLLFDDHSVVESDPAVRFVDESGRVDVEVFDELWLRPRPLRQLTHRIDFLLFGDGMAGPHAENILLHVLVGLAGYLLLRRIGTPRPTAWAAAALFLLSPVCAESIGILSHRKEILAALFLLLGTAAAIRRPDRVSAAAFACFLLAVCAKETAALFPVFFVLALCARRTDGVPDGGDAPRAVRRTVAAYAALAVAAAVLAWLQIRLSMDAQGGNPGEDPFRAGHFPLGTAFAPALSAALRAFPRWIASLVWPFGHSIDPPFALRRPLLSAECLLGAASVALFAFALVRTARDRSRLFPPLAWCGAALAPYLWPPFLQSGATQVLADRYAYLAAFGAAWLVAVALESIPRPRARAAILAALLTVFGVSSFLLSLSFFSETALWARACRLNPRSFQAAHNHAMALWREGKDAAAAEAEFRRMSELSPDFDYGLCSRAQTMAEAGNPLGALRLLDEAIRARPESMQLLRQRGIVRFGLGRMESCRADFAAAERLGADDPFFRREYGEALIRLAAWPEARRQFILADDGTPESRRETRLSSLLLADPPARSGRVVVAGDSVPHGTATVGEDGAEHGLADFLSRSLRRPASAFSDVAVPGSFARDLPASLREAVRSAPAVSACVVWSGHNDAFFGARPEETLRSLALAALEVRKAGARPILVGPLPVRSAPDRDRRDQERRLARLNDLLRGFCEEAGIAFVDARAALAAAFPDGVEAALDPDTGNHLRYAGMEAVAAAVRRALASPSARPAAR